MNRQKIRKLFLLISFLLLPITMYYFSPVLIIVGAAHGIIAGSFITFALMFLVSLVFGRLFCGWLCPAGGLQEQCMAVRDKPAAGGKFDRIKYVLWFLWLTAIIVLFVLSGGFKEYDPWLGTVGGISIAEPKAYIVFYGFITLIALLALLAGKRGFCHYVCWMAPFMVIGSKIGALIRIRGVQLQADKEKCIACKLCTRSCVMSLPVQELVQQGSMTHSECILCGACADICPKKAISLKAGWKA